VFEIGTFEGLTAAVFARNAPDAQVYSLDLPQRGDEGLSRTRRSFAATSIAVTYDSGRLLPIFGCADRVELVRGDSAILDFAPYHPIDLFFVDGAHTTDYVARDTLSAIDVAAPEGWIVWHDALVPDVLRVLRAVATVHPVLWIRETNLAVCTSPPPRRAVAALIEGWAVPRRG
jgi:predicted O-methyltransferase YrrM